MADDHRTQQIHIRVSSREKAIITERAVAAGEKVGEYMRRLGLGQGATRRLRVTRMKAQQVATVAHVDDDRIEQEIHEAKLGDDIARRAFVERRTRELKGAGHTTPVARRLAEAEWRDRA